MAGVKFKVSSGLKSIIGRDLITNDFVAIFELVKNSFDARATKVRVVFDLEERSLVGGMGVKTRLQQVEE